MLRFDPDEIEQSGGFVTVASVGQEAAVAMGANSGRENIFSLQALTLQLPAVGGNEIQKIFFPELRMRRALQKSTLSSSRRLELS